MKLSILVAIFLLTFSSSAVPTKDKLIVLKKEFTLKVGETGKAPRDKLEVEFVSVADDSRCPKGVTCVWAGNAKVLLRFRKGNNKPVDVELNTNIKTKIHSLFGYVLRLEKLEPYPEASGPINPSDYVVTLSVHKV
jgi:hypothetical protein